jgi:hypothetical protein
MRYETARLRTTGVYKYRICLPSTVVIQSRIVNSKLEVFGDPDLLAIDHGKKALGIIQGSWTSQLRYQINARMKTTEAAERMMSARSLSRRCVNP